VKESNYQDEWLVPLMKSDMFHRKNSSLSGTEMGKLVLFRKNEKD